jgi:hypothetical protein
MSGFSAFAGLLQIQASAIAASVMITGLLRRMHAAEPAGKARAGGSGTGNFVGLRNAMRLSCVPSGVDRNRLQAKFIPFACIARAGGTSTTSISPTA